MFLLMMMMMMKNSWMTHTFAFSPPVKMQPWPLLYVGRGFYIYIYNFLWLSTAISRGLFWLRHAGTDRSCFLRLNKSLIFYLCSSGRASCARRWMTGKAPPMMKGGASGWIIAGSAEYPLFLLV